MQKKTVFLHKITGFRINFYKSVSICLLYIESKTYHDPAIKCHHIYCVEENRSGLSSYRIIINNFLFCFNLQSILKPVPHFSIV